MIRFLSFAILVSSLIACSKTSSPIATSGPSVIAGQTVSELSNERYSVIALGTGENYRENFECTAVLVGSKTLLTASHCIDEVLANEYKAFIPSLTTECSVTSVVQVEFAPGSQVSEFGVHNPDVALLKLEKEICGSLPVKLGSAPQPGMAYASYGFGIGTEGPLPDFTMLFVLPDPAKFFENQFINDPAMTEFTPKIKEFHDYLMTYSTATISVEEKSVICNGDSGGPVLGEDLAAHEKFVVGINGAQVPHPFRGNEECNNAYIQYFTPVAPYAGWITETLRKWSPIQ